jgi:uncharacterized membrane protein
MPLTTRLLAEFITYRAALVLYWLNILLLGAMLFWSWSMRLHHGWSRKIRDARFAGAICRRVVIAQSLYAFGALLCV